MDTEMLDCELPPAGQGKCARCSLLYGKSFDVMIPDAAWVAISPRGNGGGLLCPNCMHALLVEAGCDVGEAPGIIVSGPMCSPTNGSDYYFGVAKAALQQNTKLRDALVSKELEDPLADLAHWLDELNTPHVILPDECPEGERIAARTGFAYACDKIAEEITRRRDLSSVVSEKESP